MESGLEIEDAHWEHDPPHFTCCTFQEEPWENHDFHITFFFFLWEEPLEELEEALHGSCEDGGVSTTKSFPFEDEGRIIYEPLHLYEKNIW